MNAVEKEFPPLLKCLMTFVAWHEKMAAWTPNRLPPHLMSEYNLDVYVCERLSV